MDKRSYYDSFYKCTYQKSYAILKIFCNAVTSYFTDDDKYSEVNDLRKKRDEIYSKLDDLRKERNRIDSKLRLAELELEALRCLKAIEIEKWDQKRRNDF